MAFCINPTANNSYSFYSPSCSTPGIGEILNRLEPEQKEIVDGCFVAVLDCFQENPRPVPKIQKEILNAIINIETSKRESLINSLLPIFRENCVLMVSDIIEQFCNYDPEQISNVYKMMQSGLNKLKDQQYKNMVIFSLLKISEVKRDKILAQTINFLNELQINNENSSYLDVTKTIYILSNMGEDQIVNIVNLLRTFQNEKRLDLLNINLILEAMAGISVENREKIIEILSRFPYSYAVGDCVHIFKIIENIIKEDKGDVPSHSMKAKKTFLVALL